MTTQTSQHTPGPWGVHQKSGDRPITLKRTHWEIGSSRTNDGVAIAFGDDDANARLIAAAPELLENIRDTEAELAGILADPTGIPEPIVDLLGELANRQAVLLARLEGKE